MASLKEIKSRINSVNSTRKITSAMKMIASSKLHKAQTAITHFLPYQQKLNAILSNLLAADTSYDSPFVQAREVKLVAFVVCSSNTSLCGAFNANIIKEFKTSYEQKKELGADNIVLYPVGKKIADAMKKAGLQVEGNYKEMADKVSFDEVKNLSTELIDKYSKGDIDEVILIYYHFKSMGTQVLINSPFLPFNLDTNTRQEGKARLGADYIFEPSKEEILESLIPTVLHSRLFSALLDSSASEHAARTIAMQIATDNANELLQDLKIQYNKTRQQAVTNELLDILGGAAALQ